MTSHPAVKQEYGSSHDQLPRFSHHHNDNGSRTKPLISLHYITYNELPNGNHQSFNIDCAAVSKTPTVDVQQLWRHLHLLTAGGDTPVVQQHQQHVQPSTTHHHRLPLEYHSVHHLHHMMKKLSTLGTTNKYLRQRTPPADDLEDDVPSNQSLAASSRTMSVPTSSRSNSNSSHQRQLQYMRDVSDEDLAVKRLHLLHEHPSPSRVKRHRSAAQSASTTPRHSVTTVDHSANQRVMEASLANHNDALSVLTQIALNHATSSATTAAVTDNR